MRNKIILLTLLVFSVSSYASWFVGGNVGGNITRDTGVGDLPMAREEFGVNAFKDSDRLRVESIGAQILANGGNNNDVLHAIKDLMVLRMVYDYGWNFNVYGGYGFKNINVGVKWNYINSPYKAINKVADGKESVSSFWDGAYGSKEGMIINSFLVFFEYEIEKMRYYRLIPLVGVGLGFGRTADRLISSQKDVTRRQTVFAYEFKIGANYSFTNKFQAILETVFFGTSEVKATNNKIKQFQLNLGARYRFS